MTSAITPTTSESGRVSIGGTTLDLWRRAPVWRLFLLGAIGTTFLAFIVGRSNVVPSSVTTPHPNITAPAPPRNVQCGPQGQTVLQAPIVVSGTGQLPPNVRGLPGNVQTQGISNAVEARFVQFSTHIDAARMEPREGERCVKMKGALDKLDSFDYAYANCFQDGEKKLVAAQSCSADLNNSEQRFERLAAAFTASREDVSAEKVEELARARSRLMPFDETRERWNRDDGMVSAGDRAVKAITESDMRISALKQAAALSGKVKAELEALANVANLTALDRARLSTSDKVILDRAEQAKSELLASDKRLARLAESVAGNPSKNEASRAQLISSLSSLTGLDLQRATPAQMQVVEQARRTAGEFAVSDLVIATNNVDFDNATPAVYQRLRDLLSAVEKYGGQVEPGSSAAQAVEIARRADSKLVRSDLRISNMHDIVHRIEQGGPAKLGSDVLKIYEEIESFDVARMTDDDQQAYEFLESARGIEIATQRLKLTRAVPLYISADRSDELTELALEAVRRGLREAGFNLVSAEERSAVSVLLRRSEVVQKSVIFSGSTLTTAEVSLSVSGKWTFAGKSVLVPSAKGDAAGSDFSSLQRKAVEEAAGVLVEQFISVTDA